MTLFAFGVGVGTKNSRGQWLEVFFPEPRVEVSEEAIKALINATKWHGKNSSVELGADACAALSQVDSSQRALAASKRPLVAVFCKEDAPPQSVPEAYLKLHLLSHRLVRPHGVNLTGIFQVLPNVAWTSTGPMDPDDVAAARLAARAQGTPFFVRAVDKFPPLLDYVMPKGVRIADGARVRLGAWLGPGTTIMHEGFVNFNAGTEGPNMVEGRLSAGVVAAAGTDIGGGASTMGTLSGGGDIVISLGKNCLIGANAGVGIPLGDGCTVEAGLYLTAAAKVRVLDRTGATLQTVKARALAHRSGLLFRRNSQDGAIECLPAKGAVALNEDLHQND